MPCGPFIDTLREDFHLVKTARIFQDSVKIVHDNVPDPSRVAFAMFLPADSAFAGQGEAWLGSHGILSGFHVSMQVFLDHNCAN